MGATAKLRAMFKDPAYETLPGVEGRAARPGQGAPARLRERLGAQVDVVAAPGSIIVVADQDFHTVEASFEEAFFTSTSPNLQIIASLDVARRQMGSRATSWCSARCSSRSRCAARSTAPADLEVLQGGDAGRDDRPGTVGFLRLRPGGWSLTRLIGALDGDEFFLDPTRITLLCGNAGYDGTQFKALLSSEYDIQIQQDFAQQRAGADQHQQHAQRPRCT